MYDVHMIDGCMYVCCMYAYICMTSIAINQRNMYAFILFNTDDLTYHWCMHVCMYYVCMCVYKLSCLNCAGRR